MKKTLIGICLILSFLGCASPNKKNHTSKADQYQLAMQFNNLGAKYVNKDMLDEAIMQFKRALVINPDFAEAHNNLGVAYCKKKMLIWDLRIDARTCLMRQLQNIIWR